VTLWRCSPLRLFRLSRLSRSAGRRSRSGPPTHTYCGCASRDVLFAFFVFLLACLAQSRHALLWIEPGRCSSDRAQSWAARPHLQPWVLHILSLLLCLDDVISSVLFSRQCQPRRLWRRSWSRGIVQK
jgi:hypothetical protein